MREIIEKRMNGQVIRYEITIHNQIGCKTRFTIPVELVDDMATAMETIKSMQKLEEGM